MAGGNGDALTARAQDGTGSLNQDTIDGLLSQLGGDDPAAGGPGAGDVGGEPLTGSISGADLEALMAKHAGDGTETSGPARHD